MVPLLAAAALLLARRSHQFPPDPTVPPRLRAQAAVQPLMEGFVDPTLPPYLAVADGAHDDGAALQMAIDDAYAAHMTVYLPPGRTFLVSRQLRFIQANRSRSFGFHIVGGGRGGTTPTLKLADGAGVAGGHDVGGPVFMLFELLNSPPDSPAHDEGEHYQSRVRNLHIDMGRNPAVSALSMNGAQLCAIEDVR